MTRRLPNEVPVPRKWSRFDPKPYTPEETKRECQCGQPNEQRYYAHENGCPVYFMQKSDHP